LVRSVAVYLVRAHEDERRLGAGLAHGLEQVQRAARVDVEIVEGAVLGEVVRWLRGGVDQEVRLEAADEVDHRRAVPDVERMVGEVRGQLPQALEIPGGVAVWSEEVTPHVVVDAVPLPAAMIEEGRSLGADEPAAAGDEDPLHADGSPPRAGPS